MDSALSGHRAWKPDGRIWSWLRFLTYHFNSSQVHILPAHLGNVCLMTGCIKTICAAQITKGTGFAHGPPLSTVGMGQQPCANGRKECPWRLRQQRRRRHAIIRRHSLLGLFVAKVWKHTVSERQGLEGTGWRNTEAEGEICQDSWQSNWSICPMCRLGASIKWLRTHTHIYTHTHPRSNNIDMQRHAKSYGESERELEAGDHLLGEIVRRPTDKQMAWDRRTGQCKEWTWSGDRAEPPIDAHNGSICSSSVVSETTRWWQDSIKYKQRNEEKSDQMRLFDWYQ